MSAIRPAAARWRATSRATARARVAKAVLIGAVPPIMVKTDGQSRRPADRGVRRLPPAARRQPRAVLPRCRRAAPSTASTGRARKVSQGVIQNWWRQGMMGGAKAHYDCIKAFSETDFTEDLKAIDVPDAGHARRRRPDRADRRLRACCRRKLLKNGTLKVYEGFPHGMCTTHAGRHQPRPAGLRAGLSGRRASGPRIAQGRSVMRRDIVPGRRFGRCRRGRHARLRDPSGHVHKDRPARHDDGTSRPRLTGQCRHAHDRRSASARRHPGFRKAAASGGAADRRAAVLPAARP